MTRAVHRDPIGDSQRLLGRAVGAGLLAAGGVYALHHTRPLDGHGPAVVVLVVTAAAALALPATLRRPAPRELPTILTLGPGGTAVRDATPDDLDFAALLHAQLLPHGFFPSLGHRFLRAYVETFLASPHAVALLATVGPGTPAGTLMGILRPAAHAQWVLQRRGPRLAALGVLALLARPRLALHFARTRVGRYRRIWRRRTAPAADAAVAAERQPAVLSHVAVAPGAQGASLGRKLLDAFVALAERAGCERVEAATREGEDGAAGFYLRQGWVETGTQEDFDGQKMLRFSVALDAR